MLQASDEDFFLEKELYVLHLIAFGNLNFFESSENQPQIPHVQAIGVKIFLERF